LGRHGSPSLAQAYDRDRLGRLRHLSEKQEVQLAKLILKCPDPKKNGTSAYTLDNFVRISEEKFGVSYHPSSMLRIVRCLGFSRQKARLSSRTATTRALLSSMNSMFDPRSETRQLQALLRCTRDRGLVARIGVTHDTGRWIVPQHALDAPCGC
jgi:Winged helix-turn helix